MTAQPKQLIMDRGFPSSYDRSIAGKVTANYWLSHVYPPEVGRAHRDGDLHIHDLDMFANQRADLQVLRLEPFDATLIDWYRHEVDDAKQRNELRHGGPHSGHRDYDADHDHGRALLGVPTRPDTSRATSSA